MIHKTLFIIIERDNKRVVDILATFKECVNGYSAQLYDCKEMREPTGDVVIGDLTESDNGVFMTFANSVLRNIDWVMTECYNIRNAPAALVAQKILDLNNKIKIDVKEVAL